MKNELLTNISGIFLKSSDQFMEGFENREINVYPLTNSFSCTSYTRKDLYKIALFESKGTLFFKDHKYEIDQPTLIYAGTDQFSWSPISKQQKGWTCQFSGSFPRKSDAWTNFYLLRINPIYRPEKSILQEIRTIFKKLKQECNSPNHYNFLMLQNHLQLLIFNGLTLYEQQYLSSSGNSAHRITANFKQLLSEQFPIVSPESKIRFRTPQDFAQILNIHVNYLNFVVKQVTGISPGILISQQIINEAKKLLINTDWSISTIANVFSFNQCAHFTAFFKKHVGKSPNQFRKERFL